MRLVMHLTADLLCSKRYQAEERERMRQWLANTGNRNSRDREHFLSRQTALRQRWGPFLHCLCMLSATLKVVLLCVCKCCVCVCLVCLCVYVCVCMCVCVLVGMIESAKYLNY